MSRVLTQFWLLILLLSIPPFPSTVQGTTDPPAGAPRTEAPAVRNATIVYYKVAGATAPQLLEQLTAFGPVSDEGYRGHALTRWWVSWRWPVPADGSCRLEEAVVAQRITVTFPRWTPPATATPALIARWNAYARALAAHEQGHVDFVVAHVPAILAAIKEATCATANAAAERAAAAIDQHDRAYDAATGHGVTQGASFP